MGKKKCLKWGFSKLLLSQRNSQVLIDDTWILLIVNQDDRLGTHLHFFYESYISSKHVHLYVSSYAKTQCAKALDFSFLFD